jgi:hypothetical protein
MRRAMFLAVVACVILSSGMAAAPVRAEPGGGGGVGMGILKPFSGGPWGSTNLQFNWSIKLTKAPSWGVWADGIVVPETNNLQAGGGINVNLGEAATRAGIRLSDEFQGILDRTYVGGAILTDKFDFQDWSHWRGGFYGKYALVTF